MLRFLLPTYQTCLAPNQVVAHCVGTDFWLDNIRRESRRTRELRHLLQNKFALGWKNAQHVQISQSLLSITNFRDLQQPDLLPDRFESG